MVNELSILETMYFFGMMFRMGFKRIRERAQFLGNLLELPPLNKRIKEMRYILYQLLMLLYIFLSLYSGGEQRRVSFAVSLIQQPPLLIMDEPTVGMDSLLRQRFNFNLYRMCNLLEKQNYYSFVKNSSMWILHANL